MAQFCFSTWRLTITEEKELVLHTWLLQKKLQLYHLQSSNVFQNGMNWHSDPFLTQFPVCSTFTMRKQWYIQVSLLKALKNMIWIEKKSWTTITVVWTQFQASEARCRHQKWICWLEVCPPGRLESRYLTEERRNSIVSKKLENTAETVTWWYNSHLGHDHPRAESHKAILGHP